MFINKYLMIFPLVICSIALIILMNELLYGNNVIISSFIGMSYFSISVFVLVFILAMKIKSLKFHPLVIYTAILLVFYSLGILGLSSYRASLNNLNWTILLTISLFSLGLGFCFANLFSKSTKKKIGSKRKNYIFNNGLYFLLMVSMSIIALMLNARYGFPMINPSNRFTVPAIYQYLVEFTVPATLCMISYQILIRNKIKYSVYLLLWSMLISASLGYRNQIVILFLGFILILAYTYTQAELVNKYSLIKRSLSVSLLISILFIFMGTAFINRQENSQELVNWHDFVSYFEVENYRYITPLMPLHLSSREAMGVTEVAYSREVNLDYLVGESSLFFMDLITLLPGYQPSAGSVLGSVVNLSDSTSLTVGIIGGLYLSGGIVFLITGMMILGFLNTVFWDLFKINNSIIMFSTAIIILSYSLELINRGLFKPMYVLVLLFPFIFFKTIKKEVKQ